MSQDGATVGGVYFWDSRAEALFTDSWHAFVKGMYGTEPVATYFYSSVIMDNTAQQVLTDG